MSRIPYNDVPGLQHVYLEDSFVLGVREYPGRVEFDLEVVLTPDHPDYSVPRENEQYCYRPATLVFPRVTDIRWLERHFRKIPDPSGSPDYGNIDVFEADGRKYKVCGEWGSVELLSDPPQLIPVDR